MTKYLSIIYILEIMEKIQTFESDCVRKKSNWTKANPQYKFDSDKFDPELLKEVSETNSPKLIALLNNIRDLDKKDKEKDGHFYKHFIFCDVKSSNQGARMLASAFVANGFHLAYDAHNKNHPNSPKTPSPAKKVREDTPRPSSVLTNYKQSRKLKSMDNIEESDEEESPKTGGAAKKRFDKIVLDSDSKLKKTKHNNFYLLSSVNVYDQPINVSTKKTMLAKFNNRDSNVHGEEVRFIIMDSGFKEGIDLFDIKYVHIFEPAVNSADQKQVIGRGTRTCGQKGLDFHPSRGWPLHVFVYDISIPDSVQRHFLDSKTTFELYLKSLNLDMKLLSFLEHMEKTSIYGSVDYELNKAVHEFSVMSGGGLKSISLPTSIHGASKSERFTQFRNYVKELSDVKWENVKMENMCVDKTGGGNIIQYTPTQRFVKTYFTPQCPVKGMLLWHSTGTGKTCSAIAAATSTFAPQGYTVLWVTRTTLKNDIWKNMFDQVCNEQIRTMIADGIQIPEEHNKRMKLLSDAWKIRPISYKQFSNLVSKENNYYKRLVDINGSTDPLRKTLLIIDEAHKLYGGGDLSSIERPDMKALHKSLMDSYQLSGPDSVRLLLMTATPITENPMELVKLMNLCKESHEQMPEEFPVFSEQYLHEDGSFTKDGKTHYLDNVAGHISYLNREKDARQFAQPIIKHIHVPMMKDAKIVQEMDKRVVRDDTSKEIEQLYQQMEKESQEIDAEFKDLEATRFYALRDLCNEYEGTVKKGCLKMANQNIKELVSEAKDYTKLVKNKINQLKDVIGGKKKFKQDILKKLSNLKKTDPTKVKEFEDSLYYVLKYDCGKVITKKGPIENTLSQHPQVQEIQHKLDAFKTRISDLDDQLNVMVSNHKTKLRELKTMLRNGELSKLETFVVKHAIKIEQSNHKKTMKLRKKQVGVESKDLLFEQKIIKKDLSKKMTILKKEMKNEVKEKLKEEKEKKKTENKLRKTLRKQGDLREEFKEGLMNDLVSKYIDKTKKDFRDVKHQLVQEKETKEREKEEKAEEKERVKEEKKRLKQQEQEYKRQEKERAKEEKRKQKEDTRKKKAESKNETRKKR